MFEGQRGHGEFAVFDDTKLNPKMRWSLVPAKCDPCNPYITSTSIEGDPCCVVGENSGFRV